MMRRVALVEGGLIVYRFTGGLGRAEDALLA